MLRTYRSDGPTLPDRATLMVLTQTPNKLSNRYSDITLKACLHVCISYMHVTSDRLFRAKPGMPPDSE